ncbi:hypothetical protein MHYP_G00146700 [Metynnis hypsauchen]
MALRPAKAAETVRDVVHANLSSLTVYDIDLHCGVKTEVYGEADLEPIPRGKRQAKQTGRNIHQTGGQSDESCCKSPSSSLAGRTSPLQYRPLIDAFNPGFFKVGGGEVWWRGEALSILLVHLYYSLL